MPHVCPRPCSRLAAAAVFISVGVVQFVVGIILLRSKYVFLLAGPDFWTSGCNIAVGCLLGVSTSVWKQSRKRQSKKHTLRRHFLFALVFSGLIMNATTLGILVLGKGNTLLSIRLESDGKYSESTFAREVLAYAYVTSVCCPVVCIVISIVSMSGSCFSSARKTSMEKNSSLNRLKKNRSRSLQWVYNTESLDLSKNKARDFVPTPSSSESSSDSESDNVPVQQKQTSSIEELQCVFNRMAQGERDNILRDSTIMLRQLDHRRKNRHNFSNDDTDGSYSGPALSRMRESAASKTRAKASLTEYHDSNISKTGNLKRYSGQDDNARFSPGDITLKPIIHSRNKRPDILQRNPYAKEFTEYQDTSQLVSSKYKNFREKPQIRPKLVDNTLGFSSGATESYINGIAATQKKSRKVSEIETKCKPVCTEYNHRMQNSGSFRDNHQIICETKGRLFYEENKYKEPSPVLNECFSPDGSEFSLDSTFDLSRTSSWAGEFVPISINNSSVARLSQKLIPVASPVVPNTRREQDLPKISDDSGIGSIQSNSFNSEIANQNDLKDKESKLSSFRETVKIEGKENMHEYPKVGSQGIKKYDLSRVMTMASISEEPNLESDRSEPKFHSSSLCESTTPKKPKGYIRQQSLPSGFLGSSKEAYKDDENSEKNITPKRKRSASGKILQKLWSVTIPENQTDFLDQVVDNDSLIGLSEEELIARQLKNRSIRKVVQQRIKEEMMV